MRVTVTEFITIATPNSNKERNFFSMNKKWSKTPFIVYYE